MFVGRDKHPEKSDVGHEGIVIATVQRGDDPELGLQLEEWENYVIYDVKLDDGSVLEFTNEELQKL